MQYYTMCHRGGLKEALETLNELSEEVAKKLIESNIYSYYSYDKRLEASRYILKNMDKNQGLPTWILESSLGINIMDQINRHCWPGGTYSR